MTARVTAAQARDLLAKGWTMIWMQAASGAQVFLRDSTKKKLVGLSLDSFSEVVVGLRDVQDEEQPLDQLRYRVRSG